MIRIAITGIESTGKTTLAAALSVAIGAEVAAEAARNDTRVRAGTTGVADLERLAREQLEACHGAERRAIERGSKTVISDSDSTVIRWWGRWVFDAEVPGLIHLEKWADFTLLCAPNIPWEADPLRTLPDPVDRKRLHQCYAEDLQARRAHPWALIDGLTQEKRLEQSVRAVQSFQNFSALNE